MQLRRFGGAGSRGTWGNVFAGLFAAHAGGEGLDERDFGVEYTMGE